ncbi:hypothetical protein CONLIGDRAFT_99114 [Coniochaeta ligniaria NRRL 30616]|uniref:DUF7770 domain-containing protein n=1 Tax=Coniochaeta ligniaria NRRL 30616 TaxID=1408157 RepID=A0A1J7IB18_9PEZI|nr:hypothetical protein CONLIGDRAFT_99114 [Coniochaeta ligniaria NRRL 30616]
MGCCSSSETPKKEEAARQPQSHQSFEMHNIDTLNYVPEDAVARIRDPKRLVTQVHIVACSVLETGGNHWVISLQTTTGGEEESAVRLEIRPGAYPGRDGYIGRLDVIHSSFEMMTRHHHKLVTIPPTTPGHCVAEWLDAIVAAGNHRYEFSREGRGCTGWVRDQFYLFVETGLLPPGWEQRVEHALTSAWVDGVLQGPWPVTQGRYLRRRKRMRGGKTANRS